MIFAISILTSFLILSLFANFAQFLVGVHYDRQREKLWWKHFKLIHKYRVKTKHLRYLLDDYYKIERQPRITKKSSGVLEVSPSFLDYDAPLLTDLVSGDIIVSQEKQIVPWLKKK